MTLDHALESFTHALTNRADSYALTEALADLTTATRAHINQLHQEETR